MPSGNLFATGRARAMTAKALVGLFAATMLPFAAAQAAAWRPPPFDPADMRRAGYTLVFDHGALGVAAE